MSPFRFLPLRRASRSARLVFLAALLLGVFLRFFQLGHDNLWSDEVSVYQAAIQPTFGQMIEAIQVFAMAMPLDYFLCRVAAGFGSSEFILRFSSALFGCLTLLVYAGLAIRVIGRRAAPVAVLLIAVAPTLIHFSQELRFYSALIFFYGLSVAILLRALDRPDARGFLLYVLVASVGVYFHPYVLLSTLVGWLSLSTPAGQRLPDRPRLVFMTASTLLLGLVFLPGYLMFKSFLRDQYSTVFTWNTLPQLAIGSGFLSFRYLPSARSFGPFELLMILGALGGLAAIAARPARDRELRAMLLAAVFQVILILGADEKEHYWFAYRQIVHLVPTVCLVVALGLGWSVTGLLTLIPGKPLARRVRGATGISLAILALAIPALAAPRLRQYYAYAKSNGRAVAAGLLQRFDPGDRVLVLPHHNRRLYIHYMDQLAVAGRTLPELEHGDFVSQHRLAPEELNAFIPPEPHELLLALTFSEAARVRGFPGFRFETVVAPDVDWGAQTALLAVRAGARPSPDSAH